jgi:hypothetical protein
MFIIIAFFVIYIVVVVVVIIYAIIYGEIFLESLMCARARSSLSTLVSYLITASASATILT